MGVKKQKVEKKVATTEVKKVTKKVEKPEATKTAKKVVEKKSPEKSKNLIYLFTILDFDSLNLKNTSLLLF